MPRPEKEMWRGLVISEMFIHSLTFQFSKSWTQLLDTSCLGFLKAVEEGVISCAEAKSFYCTLGWTDIRVYKLNVTQGPNSKTPYSISFNKVCRRYNLYLQEHKQGTLFLLCFLLMGSRSPAQGCRCMGPPLLSWLYPPHREKSFEPRLGFSHCKLNKCTKKCTFWGYLSKHFGDNQQIAGNGELVWNFFLLDISSVITISYIFSINCFPWYNVQESTLKRLSVPESREESVLHV